MEATVEFKVDNVIDLSADIAWAPIQMDSEEESNDKEEEVKAVADPLKTLLFFEKMKRLSPHRLPLKEQMRDHTINYVDLLCSNLFPPR